MTMKDTGLVTTTGTQSLTGSWFSGSSESTFTKDYKRSWMSGVDIPHFHKRKAAGELLPHTPFTQWVGEKKLHPGSHYAQVNNNTPWSRITNLPGYGEVLRPLENIDDPESIMYLMTTADTSFAQAYVQAAAGRIYSKGWDALTFAGELPSLRRMIKSIARKADNIARGHTSKRILELWLESRYGWRTLAYDIRDLNNAINEWDASRQLYSERAGFSYTDYGNATHSYGSANSSIGDGSFEVYEEYSTRHSIRGSVTGRIKPTKIILDPLKTGWELVPYSFVLDWVINVGSAIDAYQFLRHVGEYSASYGTKSELTWSATIQNVVPNAGRNVTTYNVSASANANITKEVRTPTGVSAIPQYNPRLLDGELGLDLLALSRLRARI